MVSPHKIKFNNIESVELPIDLIIEVAFDGDNGETSTYLNREAIASEMHDGRYKRVHGYKYTESFSPKFTFTKKGFGDFTIDEVRQVLKWLTSTSQTAVLDVYYTHDDAVKVIDWSAIGGWTEISTYKLANNRTVGITATFEAITPYAMSGVYGRDDNDEPIVYDARQGNRILIDIDTDDNQPVYPIITIQQKGTVVTIPAGTTYNMYSDMVPNTVYYNGINYYWKSDESALVTGTTEPNYGWIKVTRDAAYATTDEIQEETVYYYTSDQKYRWIDPYTFKSSTTNPNLDKTSVKIINQHYNFFNQPSTPVAMVVKNNTATEKVTVDCSNRLITSTNTRRIFGNDFDWSWLPLYDGRNELTIDGNCTVSIEYRTVIKCGEY